MAVPPPTPTIVAGNPETILAYLIGDCINTIGGWFMSGVDELHHIPIAYAKSADELRVLREI